jgi:hypothetical protein
MYTCMLASGCYSHLVSLQLGLVGELAQGPGKALHHVLHLLLAERRQKLVCHAAERHPVAINQQELRLCACSMHAALHDVSAQQEQCSKL